MVRKSKCVKRLAHRYACYTSSRGSYFEVLMKPWSHFSVRKEGERTKKRSIFEMYDLKSVKNIIPNLTAEFKGELNPEMKLCELLVLGHCIHLPLILFACASSGQSYNNGSPVLPNFCDVIDTAMTGDPIAF